MLAQVLRQWFWDCYDFLGRLLLANVVIVAIVGIVSLYLWAFFATFLDNATPAGFVLVSFVGVLAVLPVAGVLLLAPFAHFGALTSAEKDPGLHDFLRGYKHAGRLYFYLFTMTAIIATLLLNTWFYATRFGWPGYLLGGFTFWLAVFAALSLLPGIPLTMRTAMPVLRILKTAPLVTLKHAGLMLGVAFVLIALAAIGIFVLRLGGVLLFGAAGTGMLLNSLYDVLLDFEERREAAAVAHAGRAPRTWKQLKALEKDQEEESMRKARYNRTFRDIIRPWDM